MAFQPTHQCLFAPLFLVIPVSIALALPALSAADTGDAALSAQRLRLALAVEEDEGSAEGVGAGERDESTTTAVIEAVFERMGETLDITTMPHDAANDAMASNEVKGSFGWQPSSERMVRFHFSDPVAVIPLVVFSDAFVAIDPETPAELSGRSMCLATGTSPPDEIRRLIDQGAVRQQPANDLATCARLVHDGQIDFFVAGNQAGIAAIESIELADEFHVATDNPIGLETLHLVSPRSNPDGRALIADFDQALADLSADGTIDTILADGTLTAIPAK